MRDILDVLPADPSIVGAIALLIISLACLVLALSRFVNRHHDSHEPPRERRD